MTARREAGPRLSAAGTGAALFEAEGGFDLLIQQRIWALCDAILAWENVREALVGVTNLLLIWNEPPNTLDVVRGRLLELWDEIEPKPVSGTVHEIPVSYGGKDAIDFEQVLAHADLDAGELVRLHSAPLYTVCAIGAAPGFGYLHGLDSRLTCPRKASPAMRIPVGSVFIGGAQTAISSQTGPSGWNVIGRSEVALFDLSRSRPSLLQVGDQLRFCSVGVSP